MKPLEEMTPEEIRLEIAERKGMKNVRELRLWDSGTNPLICDEINLIGHRIIPDWPASIAAAMELVAETQVEPNDQYFCLECIVSISNKWRATVGYHQRIGMTAPMAICLAWLAWKRSEDK